MSTGWESFPFEVKGGLVSNLPRLQHGLVKPGSARQLVNFEPSVKGGYRRINGYTKFASKPVPTQGSVLVQGSGQTGSSLEVAHVLVAPLIGSKFVLEGVEYTITSLSSFPLTKTATINVSPDLVTPPADKASLTFENRTSLVEGLHHLWNSVANAGTTLAVRDGSVYSWIVDEWVDQGLTYMGDLRIHDNHSSGSTLHIDGFDNDDYGLEEGDHFFIEGVDKSYRVSSKPTVTAGHAVVSITPALDSSPANDAAVTLLTLDLSEGSKCRFANFNFEGTELTVMVDSSNYPLISGPTGGVTRVQGTEDVKGAEVVTSFADSLFFGTKSLLSFTAPFTSNDFDTGNGAGTLRLPSTITGLISFRSKLIIFTDKTIHQLEGTSFADFQLSDISSDLGCSEPDTIQEVGGDILFLGPDGLRFLGATSRIGDFNLSLASRQIQSEVVDFRRDYSNISSLVIRGKSQYRILGFTEGGTPLSTVGYLGTQFTDQESSGFEWSKTKGFKAYRTSSVYTKGAEVVIFTGEDGYVYEMEVSSYFDGGPIASSFYTPFMAIDDPRIRKTLFKGTTYYNPEGSVTGELSFKYDFKEPGTIHPPASGLDGGGNFTYFGTGVYGVSTFGGNPDTAIEAMTTGSFFTVSLEYTFDGVGTPPFTIDTILLEYQTNDRK